VKVDGGVERVDASVVLVVDDHPMVLSTYERGFLRAGYRVTTAASVGQAIAAAEATLPTLAVIDLWLGGETGIDLVAQLRRRWPAMRIVIVSASVSLGTAVRAARAGADDVVMKPTTVSQLLGLAASEDLPPTLARVEWEYMMRTLADANGNISEAARRLGIRRQSLQRKLKRNAPTC
jgi:two-component system response regulator RegA